MAQPGGIHEKDGHDYHHQPQHRVLHPAQGFPQGKLASGNLVDQILDESEGAHPAAGHPAYRGADEAQITHHDGAREGKAAGAEPQAGHEILEGAHRTGQQRPGTGVTIEARIAHCL